MSVNASVPDPTPSRGLYSGAYEAAGVDSRFSGSVVA